MNAHIELFTNRDAELCDKRSDSVDENKVMMKNISDESYNKIVLYIRVTYIYLSI